MLPTYRTVREGGTNPATILMCGSAYISGFSSHILKLLFVFSYFWQTPVETSRGRAVHLPLTARVLQKKDRGQDYGHARVSSDEGNVNWHHSKLYQTPSSADMSISNRPTPKPVYTHPNSSHRNCFFNDRLLTRQLYQSPAEALHAINQRRKSRELLRPSPSSAGTRGGYFDTEDEYMLSVGENRIFSCR